MAKGWGRAKSTHCNKCGTELNETTRYKTRALCITCGKEYSKEYHRENVRTIPKEEQRRVMYKEFAIEDRKKEFRQMVVDAKDLERDEWRELISKRLTDIINNEKKWEWISTVLTHEEKVKERSAMRKYRNSKN